VRTRFAQRTWIQRINVQTYEQDKEKEEEDTKCFISSHFWIELKFCLEQGWKGWRVEDAVQKLWKYTPKKLLEIIRNNVFQSIAYNVYPSFSNPVSRVYLPLELVLLDAREFKESKCRHMSRVKKRKGKIRSAHFFALLNRIKILPGTRTERLIGWKRGSKAMEIYPKKIVRDYTHNVFQSIAYNVYPSFRNPVSRIYLTLEVVLLDAGEFKESRCRHMSRIKKRKGKIRSAHFFALLNRIKILPGLKMKGLRSKRRFKDYIDGRIIRMVLGLCFPLLKSFLFP
jgi:hypothetical protein